MCVFLVVVHGTHRGRLISGEFESRLFYTNTETRVILILLYSDPFSYYLDHFSGCRGSISVSSLGVTDIAEIWGVGLELAGEMTEPVTLGSQDVDASTAPAQDTVVPVSCPSGSWSSLPLEVLTPHFGVGTSMCRRQRAGAVA